MRYVNRHPIEDRVTAKEEAVYAQAEWPVLLCMGCEHAPGR